MRKKQPYTNNISNYFLLLVIIALIASCSSCAKYGCPATGQNRYINNKFNK